jgi:hypothetical protein
MRALALVLTIAAACTEAPPPRGMVTVHVEFGASMPVTDAAGDATAAIAGGATVTAVMDEPNRDLRTLRDVLAGDAVCIGCVEPGSDLGTKVTYDPATRTLHWGATPAGGAWATVWWYSPVSQDWPCSWAVRVEPGETSVTLPTWPGRDAPALPVMGAYLTSAR